MKTKQWWTYDNTQIKTRRRYFEFGPMYWDGSRDKVRIEQEYRNPHRRYDPYNPDRVSEPRAYLHLSGATAEQCRTAAAVLLEAADLLDEITPPPLSGPAWAMTDVVRDAMQEADISQSAMSEATGIPLSTLNRRMNRRGRTWLVPELAAIARVLGISLVDLVERSENAAGEPSTGSWADALAEVIGA